MSIRDEDLQVLVDTAKQVATHAYSPYSHFRVGAALRARSGRMACGCNVENASYGLTICAERSAICQMIAFGEREFTHIVIYTPTTQPTAPCGACRQMLLEFTMTAEVISVCDGPEVLRSTVGDYLPHSFHHQQIR